LFSVGIAGMVLRNPNIKAGYLTKLDTKGVNLENEIKTIQNPALRDLTTGITNWNYQNRFTVDQAFNFINKNFQKEIKEVHDILQIKQFRKQWSPE
jgi:hypothetical protein